MCNCGNLINVIGDFSISGKTIAMLDGRALEGQPYQTAQGSSFSMRMAASSSRPPAKHARLYELPRVSRDGVRYGMDLVLDNETEETILEAAVFVAWMGGKKRCNFLSQTCKYRVLMSKIRPSVI